MTRLKGIGIKNFRIFEKKTSFDFTKINILTGSNNSGKSTLLKLFQLIQANGNLKELDISKNAKSHNLGEFETLINNCSKEKGENDFFIQIPISIKEINLELFVELEYKQVSKNKGTLANLTIIDKDDNKSVFDWKSGEISYDYLLKYFEQYVNHINKDREYIKKVIKYYSHPSAGNKFETFRSEKPTESEYIKPIKLDFLNKDNDDLMNLIIEFPNYDFSKMIFEYDKKANISKENDFLKLHLQIPDLNRLITKMFPEDLYHAYYKTISHEYFNKKENKEFESEKLNLIHTTENSKLFFLFISMFFFKGILQALWNFEKVFETTNFNHIKANKDIQSRYYDISDKDEFTDLLKTFSSIIYTNDSYLKNDDYNMFLKYWIKAFDLGNTIYIENKEITLMLPYFTGSKDKKKINLADLGYGAKQIFSLLMKIIIVARSNFHEGFEDPEKGEDDFFSSSILFIEEPEANLHPDFQSKLAAMFVEASDNFNIQFIIETHSEYLIRKLQYLTAKKKIEPDASIIYYFHHPENIPKGEEQVKEIRIREDGSLSNDFGPGFFDEATNIKFDLLKIKNTQNN